jgi:O-Antigen ligase
MNNNNSPAILKSLIIYAVCVPLALCVGYLVAEVQMWDRPTYIMVGLLALLLAAPILLRWHHLLLIASWNFGLMIFFLPGSPFIWMLMVGLSLGISILQRTLNSEARFLSAPHITWPLICLTVVVLFTAKMTGGLGLRSFGSEVMGGKRYVILLFAILGYFALTARRIPPQRAGLYVALFFLGGCTDIVGDLVRILPHSLYFIYAFFPVSTYALNGGAQPERLAGVGSAATAVFLLMLARYGVRGIFMSGKLWRLVLFLLFSTLVLCGGFRLMFITCVLVFSIQFLLEGLHRTKLFFIFLCAGIIAAMLAVPYANKLPYTFQRSLAFLPLHIDPVARANAEASSNWRLTMWKALLPHVPEYLLLGKGYALSQNDYVTITSQALQGGAFAEDWGAAIAGNYHNGPLSVIIFFGIWGAIAVLWLWAASIYALYHNYRYGDPGLQTVNTLLLTFFIAHIIIFLFIFGAIDSDMPVFAGAIGLSISLNGGIRRPVEKTSQVADEPEVVAPLKPRYQPFFQR